MPDNLANQQAEILKYTDLETESALLENFIVGLIGLWVALQ